MNTGMTRDVRQAVELLREGKPLLCAEKLLNKVSHVLHSSLFFYDRFYVLHYRVRPGELSPIVSRLSGIVVRPAVAADIDRLQVMAPRGDEYSARMAGGNVGLIADDGGRVAGMIWLKQSDVHYEEDVAYPFTLPEKSGWQYDLFVDPAYRLRGVWIQLEEALIAHVAARGISDLFGLTKALNKPSVNAHVRYGYTIIEEIITLRLLGLHVYAKWRYTGGRRVFGGVRTRLNPLPRTGDAFGCLARPGERRIGDK